MKHYDVPGVSIAVFDNGWIKGTWGRTESNREAKYYEITKAGQRALKEETQGWRRMAALVERVLLEES